MIHLLQNEALMDSYRLLTYTMENGIGTWAANDDAGQRTVNVTLRAWSSPALGGSTATPPRVG